MTTVPAATRQEGTKVSADDRDLQRYWRDCQRDGEHLLALYRRVTTNRSYAEQQLALEAELVRHKDLAPRLRELIAAVDQELLTLNRFQDLDRQRYAVLLHYRNGLASLWDILLPYLFNSSSRT